MTDSAQNSKQILAQKGTAGTPSFSFLGGNTSGMYLAGTNKLGFSTAGTFAAVIDASGNVGIGTASPAYKLDVQGGRAVVSPASEAFAVGLRYNASTDGVWLGSPSANALQISSFSGTPYLNINSSGSVGIGTASPNTKLEVRSSALADSIRWTDNTNSTAFLGTIAAASTIYTNTSLAFGTGSATFSEKMRITSTGNVGIGVVPSAWYAGAGALQVGTGASVFSNNIAYSYFGTNNYFDSTNWRYMGTGAATQYVQANGASIWYYAAPGTAGNTFAWQEAMRIDSTGNVGIGTTSPAYKLDVQGGRAVVSPASEAFAVGLRYNASTDGVWLGSPSANALQISSFSGTPYLNITSSGNVGIGTASPSSKLAVTSAINDGISVTDGTVRTVMYSSTAGIASIGTTTNHPLALLANNAARMVLYNSADTLIQTASGNNNFLKLISNITTSNGGNYLIGYNTNSSFTTNAGFGLGSGVDGASTSSYFTIYKSDYAGNYAASLMTYNYAGNYWDFFTAGTLAMRINSNGDLYLGAAGGGVGKFNSLGGSGPAGFFENNGATEIINISNSSNTAFTAMRFLVNSFTTVVGSISCSTSATSFNTSSDYRLKNSVTPMTSGIAAVSALKPVTYKWNADNSNGEGFIAHELAEVIPLAVFGEKDAVDKDGKIQPQGVDYSKVVVHLVAAIQELSAKVAALEGK